MTGLGAIVTAGSLNRSFGFPELDHERQLMNQGKDETFATRISLSLAALCVVALVLLALPGHAAATHIDCGDTITSDTTLDRDLECTGDGLFVGARPSSERITLDLGGHSIKGDGDAGDVGVLVRRSRVTVKNGRISSFDEGISAGPPGTSVSEVQIGDPGGGAEPGTPDLVVRDNRFGIVVRGSHVNVDHGRVLHNACLGIVLVSSEHSTVRDSEVFANSPENCERVPANGRAGVLSEGGRDNAFLDNVVRDNVGANREFPEDDRPPTWVHGIELRGEEKSLVRGNDVRRNGVAGIAVTRGERNVLRDNGVTDNARTLYCDVEVPVCGWNVGADAFPAGIDVHTSPRTSVVGNHLEGQGRGASLVRSSGSAVLDNDAARNYMRGIEVLESNHVLAAANEFVDNGETVCRFLDRTHCGALLVADSRRTSVIANVATGAAGKYNSSGYEFTDVDVATVRDNRAQGYQGKGYGFSRVTRSDITQNLGNNAPFIIATGQRNAFSRNAAVNTSSPAEAGFTVINVDDTRLLDNVASSNAYGFRIALRPDNSDLDIERNDAFRNRQRGFRVTLQKGRYPRDAIALRDNQAMDNLGDGIEIIGAGAFGLGRLIMSLHSNEAHRNGNGVFDNGDGIEIDVRDSRLVGNSANDNTAYGIKAVEGVSAHGNRASGNGAPSECLNISCR